MSINVKSKKSKKTRPVISVSSPFIKIVEDKLTLQAALEIPDSAQIKVISILGKARMGKSTFLNAFVSRLRGINIKPFATQDDDEHCTRGIDVFYCPDHQLLLMDCQGLALEDSSHDPALLLFAYLVSDIIIFNERMMLQNEALKLMEPICTFMTYLTMDDVIKPQLYFRISDGDIVKDVKKNLEKVVSTPYKDQYQSIRDSISTLFQDEIGIVKTNTLDRELKIQLVENNYLALFEPSVEADIGFGAAIDNILEALPEGRSAGEWKAALPHIIDSINKNEQITIDKLDVVGNAAKLELIEWIARIPKTLFAELPADGLQSTFDTAIKPRQAEMKKTLADFLRKFKAVSDVIKSPYYYKLQDELAAPINAALEKMTLAANEFIKASVNLAVANKNVIVTNTTQSFTSRSIDYWDDLLTGHTKLLKAIEQIYAPVREKQLAFLTRCQDEIARARQLCLMSETSCIREMMEFVNKMHTDFIANEQERVQKLDVMNFYNNDDKRMFEPGIEFDASLHARNILLIEPDDWVDARTTRCIQAMETNVLKIPQKIQVQMMLTDEIPKAVVTFGTFDGTIRHNLMTPIRDEFVNQLRTYKPALRESFIKRKEAILFGIGLPQITAKISGLTFIVVRNSILNSGLNNFSVTPSTFTECIIPLVNRVLDSLKTQRLILQSDADELFRTDKSSLIDVLIIGAHHNPAVERTFGDLFARTVALERVKAKLREPSLFVEMSSTVGNEKNAILPSHMPLRSH